MRPATATMRTRKIATTRYEEKEYLRRICPFIELLINFRCLKVILFENNLGWIRQRTIPGVHLDDEQVEGRQTGSFKQEITRLWEAGITKNPVYQDLVAQQFSGKPTIQKSGPDRTWNIGI